MAVIDCNVLHSWASPLDIFAYLRPGWRQYVIDHIPEAWHDYFVGRGPRPRGVLTATPMTYELAYHNPLGDYVSGSMQPDAVAAGSDLGLLRRQHLDAAGIEAALLCHGTGMLVPTLGVPRLTVEFARAINDWTIERWLSAEPRLRAAILVPTQVPDLAAEEIRRVGRRDGMVAVLLGANGLGKPFGHPAYLPIFEAAHELGLAIVIRAGGDEMVETPTSPAAGGVPGTYAESRALAPQALMSHAASLISQGVMNRYPSLRFLLLGGSVAWVTPFLWRFDTDYKAFRHDALWLKVMPSELFREYFFVGTDPFVFDVAGDHLARYLETDHALHELICYASGYPDREYATPVAVERLLPAGWSARVFGENPRRFLRWSS